jgi:hypothetical protein
MNNLPGYIETKSNNIKDSSTIITVEDNALDEIVQKCSLPESLSHALKLKKLVEESEAHTEKYDVDVLITGGGIKIYYFGLLAKYVKERMNLNINRVTATSSGAIAAVCLFFKIDIDEGLKTYEEMYNHSKTTYIAEKWQKFFEEHLPENAHEICSNKLFIKAHKINTTWPFIHPVIYNTYESKHDLISIVIGSCTIPLITYPNYYFSHQGEKLIDGITPHMFEERDKDLWYLDQTCVPLSIQDSLSARKKDISPLMIKGFEDFKLWLKTNQSCGTYRLVKPNDKNPHGYSYLTRFFLQLWKHKKFLLFLTLILWICKKIAYMNGFTILYWLNKLMIV